MAKVKAKKIDPKRFYTLGEIVREEIIPGIDTIPKASRMAQTDAMTRKILQATVVPRGARGVQYKILGRNIISYLVQIEDEKSN